MERKNIAHRSGPRHSNFLTYRIVVFIKIHDFRHSWIFHGSHGDPMGPHGTHGTPWEPMDFPWIFGEAAGAADKTCGGVWGGREPPPRISRQNWNNWQITNWNNWQIGFFTKPVFPQTKLQLRRGSYFLSIELPLSASICRRRLGT